MFLDERKITELKYGVTFLVSGSGFEICHVLLKGHLSLIEYFFFQIMLYIFVSDKTSNYYKSKKEFTSGGRRENSSSCEQGTVQSKTLATQDFCLPLINPAAFFIFSEFRKLVVPVMS